MALPTITFQNDSGGSDSAASGAGPGTALTGSAATVTNGSGSITITDAVDLSGVAVDGSAALWVKTASGRQFTKITAISGSSGNWTLTVEDTTWTAGSGKTWAIGGKRKTIGNADSYTLFGANGAKGGWTVDILLDETITTTNYAFACPGSTSAGPVTIKSSAGTRPTITGPGANSTLLTVSAAYIHVENLAFSRNYSSGQVVVYITTGTGHVTFKKCKFTQSVDFATTHVELVTHDVNSGNAPILFLQCEFDGASRSCGGFARYTGSASTGIDIIDCWFHDITDSSNGTTGSTNGKAIYLKTAVDAVIVGNLITNCRGGVHAYTGMYGQYICNNTISGMASALDLIYFADAAAAAGSRVYNNVLVNSTSGYAIKVGTTAYYGFYEGNNLSYNNSGDWSGFTASSSDITGSDPSFVATGSNNYGLNSGSPARAVGLPGAGANIGGGSSTPSYADIGCAQHQDTPNPRYVNAPIRNRGWAYIG